MWNHGRTVLRRPRLAVRESAWASENGDRIADLFVRDDPPRCGDPPHCAAPREWEGVRADARQTSGGRNPAAALHCFCASGQLGYPHLSGMVEPSKQFAVRLMGVIGWPTEGYPDVSGRLVVVTHYLSASRCRLGTRNRPVRPLRRSRPGPRVPREHRAASIHWRGRGSRPAPAGR